jgi:flavin reductase (DIM6/NTAB) family NADH-FMN oxidoreductase RutF
MSKIKIDKNLFCLPWTQTLLGTHLNGKINFMALDWLTRVNFDPVMFGICVNRRNASNSAIKETGEFSINVPTVDMVAVTDYCGIVSGNKTDKSDLFKVFYGELKQAPLIEICPINIECRLSETVELPTNTFFIGEALNIYSKEDFLTDGKPDVKKVNPFLLTMPDNRFWSIGDNIGKAWNAGARYKEQLN